MRRHRWLAAAALLLLLSAGLLSLVEAEPARPRARVAFPSHMREADWRRQQARRTVAPPPAAAPAPAARPGPADAAPEAPPRRDPFLLALPARPGDAVVVFEANALRHSRLGELFLACSGAADRRALERFQRESGLDPLKDLDRVAVVGQSFVVSGFFEKARWDRLAEAGQVASYGDAGRIYTGPAPGDPTLAVWRDQLVILSPDGATARQALDQVEGRAPVPEAALPENATYGEIYGRLPGEAVQRLFSAADQALGARLAAAAGQLSLHVDAMQDVAAVVDLAGGDRAALGDLGRALGGALAAGRLQAKARGDGPLVELLDAARVVDGGETLSLELALPAATVERWFEGCAGRQAPPPAPAPAP